MNTRRIIIIIVSIVVISLLVYVLFIRKQKAQTTLNASSQLTPELIRQFENECELTLNSDEEVEACVELKKAAYK